MAAGGQTASPQPPPAGDGDGDGDGGAPSSLPCCRCSLASSLITSSGWDAWMDEPRPLPAAALEKLDLAKSPAGFFRSSCQVWKYKGLRFPRGDEVT